MTTDRISRTSSSDPKRTRPTRRSRFGPGSDGFLPGPVPLVFVPQPPHLVGIDTAEQGNTGPAGTTPATRVSAVRLDARTDAVRIDLAYAHHLARLDRVLAAATQLAAESYLPSGATVSSLEQYDRSMSERKSRVTITVDPQLGAYAEQLVQAGQAASVSAAFNDAMAEKAHRDRHRRSLWKARSEQADPGRVARMMAVIDQQLAQ